MHPSGQGAARSSRTLIADTSPNAEPINADGEMEWEFAFTDMMFVEAD